MNPIILLLLLLCVSISAAETITDTRRQMQTMLSGLNSSLFTERIKSLRVATTLLDAQLLAEMKVIDRVRELAENTAEAVNVRTEALNTLAVFKNNGVEVGRFLDLLDKIVKSDKEDSRLINAALKQMADAVPAQTKNNASNVDRDRVFATLRDLNKKREKSPHSFSETTALALITALGNFGDKDGAQKILLDTAANNNEKNLEVRAAALRALRNSFGATGVTATTDKKIASELETLLGKLKGDDLRELRMLTLESLDGLLAQTDPAARSGYTPSQNAREAALIMLNTGDNDEIIAAVNFLMRLSAKDAKVTDELLKVALPVGDARALTFKTLEYVNAALINVLYSIGNDKKNAAEAQKIINHILDLLNPALTGNNAPPEEIKETLIMGLGIIPPTFDRERPMTCLLELLKIEAEKVAPLPGRIRQLEDALAALTGAVPFRRVEYLSVENTANQGAVQMQKKVTPDLAAWQSWLEKNREKLKPTGK